MSGTILENLSGKKLSILVSILLICQLICFLVGGLIGKFIIIVWLMNAAYARPVSLYTNKNVSNFRSNSTGSGQCTNHPGHHLPWRARITQRHNQMAIFTRRRPMQDYYAQWHRWTWFEDGQPNCVCLSSKMCGCYWAVGVESHWCCLLLLQMPLPREGKVLDYSRWQQNLIGILQADLTHQNEVLMQPHAVASIDARLAYRNKGDPDNAWKYYASSLEQRSLDCTAENVRLHAHIRSSWFADHSINQLNIIYLFRLQTNIFTRARPYRCLNWALCITITICWTFVCRSIRNEEWISTLAIYTMFIWRLFTRMVVSQKFGWHWRPYFCRASYSLCIGSGIVCISWRESPCWSSICSSIWAAHWHFWIVWFTIHSIHAPHNIQLFFAFFLYSAHWISDIVVWYAVHAVVGRHSTRNFLCNAAFVLARICRWAYADSGHSCR